MLQSRARVKSLLEPLDPSSSLETRSRKMRIRAQGTAAWLRATVGAALRILTFRSPTRSAATGHQGDLFPSWAFCDCNPQGAQAEAKVWRSSWLHAPMQPEHESEERSFLLSNLRVTPG